MAGAAVLAELAVVDVVGAVTVDTGRSERGDLPVHGRTSVTAGACEPAVSAVEREIGLSVVIELPQGPVERRVAIGAFGTERRLVDIVFDVAVDALIRRVVESERRVAILADDLIVLAEQREAREVVIEAHALVPVDLDVATRAIVAELTFVRVVVGVTTDTLGRRQCIGYRLDVAIGALDIRMRAEQREVRIDCVIERHVQPFSRPVTVVADRAVDAVVRIVLEMARDAFGRLRLVENVALVARLAFEICMRTGQREAAAIEVVEQRLRPVDRVVTVLTLGAVATHVLIVIDVTVDANVGSVDILLVDVAAHAGDLGVRAEQRVPALSLVVVVRVGPLGRDVAIRTDVAEIAHVAIVVGMAGNALGFSSMERLPGFVTIVADHIDVTVAQRKIGQVVIEIVTVEPRDVRIPALVVGVTTRAGRACDIGRQRMKAGSGVQVFRDVLVAVETEVALLLARETRVAVRAFGFGVGMSGDQRARADHALERAELGLSARGRSETEADDQQPAQTLEPTPGHDSKNPALVHMDGEHME